MTSVIRKAYKDNRGSAIITGLVVSTVLMVLCLSLLLVSYSLFLSTKNNTNDISDREMLFSAIQEIERELTGEVFETVTDSNGLQKLVCSSVSADSAGETVSTEFWNDFMAGIVSRWKTGDSSPRYYNLTSIPSRKVIAEMSWSFPSGAGADISELENTILSIVYRLYDQKGEVLVKSNRTYHLKKYGGTSGTTGTSGASTDVTNSKIIRFLNGKNSKFVEVNSYFLPDEIIVNDVNTVLSFVEKWTANWYKDYNCTIPWDKKASSLSFGLSDDKGNQIACVYTNWDDNPPRLIRFLVPLDDNKSAIIKISAMNYNDSNNRLIESVDAPTRAEVSAVSIVNESANQKGYGWYFYNGSDYSRFFPGAGGESITTKQDRDVFGVFQPKYTKGESANQVQIKKALVEKVDMTGTTTEVVQPENWHWEQVIQY